MPNDKPPVIEFPCRYPIKVMGEHAEDFTACIVDIVRRHDPDLGAEAVTERLSSGGRYLSVTLVITATGTDQLKALFADLKASGRVSLVL